MGEFMFGSGTGKLTAAERSIAERVAKKCGVSFAGNPKMPDGHRYWFTAPNRGEPFDSRAAREVAEALKAAGWKR